MKLLSTLLRRFVQRGTLRVYDASGRLHTFSGTPAEPVVTMRLHNKSLYTPSCTLLKLTWMVN